MRWSTTSRRSARSATASCPMMAPTWRSIWPKRGEGSLVGSLFTHYAGLAQPVVLGVGAITAGSDRRSRLRQGIDRPRLAAARPGARRSRPCRRRRGDGRHPRRTHYMQRTALQGSPAQLAVTGMWMAGAPRRRPTSTRSGSASGSSRSAMRCSPGARRHARGHRALRRTSPATFYAHMDEAPRRPTRSSTAGWRTAT